MLFILVILCTISAGWISKVDVVIVDQQKSSFEG